MDQETIIKVLAALRHIVQEPATDSTGLLNYNNYWVVQAKRIAEEALYALHNATNKCGLCLATKPCNFQGCLNDVLEEVTPRQSRQAYQGIDE